MRLIAFVVVLFVGCPGAQKKDEKPVVTAPSIVGRFAHEGCVTQENADGTQSWAKHNAELTPTTWAADIVIYGDEGCATKYATVHLEGPYTIGAPSTKVAGAFDVDFGFTKRTVTPHVPGFVALLQSYSCGKAPYAVNESQDILDSGCKDLGYQPLAACPKDHDIVKVDGDVITFGKRPPDNNLCTPDKRPAELSPVTFKRAP